MQMLSVPVMLSAYADQLSAAVDSCSSHGSPNQGCRTDAQCPFSTTCHEWFFSWGAQSIIAQYSIRLSFWLGACNSPPPDPLLCLCAAPLASHVCTECSNTCLVTMQCSTHNVSSNPAVVSRCTSAQHPFGLVSHPESCSAGSLVARPLLSALLLQALCCGLLIARSLRWSLYVLAGSLCCKLAVL